MCNISATLRYAYLLCVVRKTHQSTWRMRWESQQARMKQPAYAIAKPNSWGVDKYCSAPIAPATGVLLRSVQSSPQHCSGGHNKH